MDKALTMAMLVRFIGILLMMSSIACSSGPQAYSKVQEVATRIRENPSSANEWDRLYGFTASSEEWERYYGYAFIAQLAREYLPNEHKSNVIKYLRDGLMSPNQAIQRECVQAIGDIGSDAVDQCFDVLVDHVKSGRECDVVWFSAEALAKLDDKVKAFRALDVLKVAASVRPAENSWEDGPQLRKFSLDSIVILSRRFLSKEQLAEILGDSEKKSDEHFIPHIRKVGRIVLDK